MVRPATAGYSRVTLGHAARSILLLREPHCEYVSQVMARGQKGASSRSSGKLCCPTVSSFICLMLRLDSHSIIACIHFIDPLHRDIA